ncbi:septation protein SepH [Curtobacterium ammoniigenes]|uniref:septation protein SepH n=1 Tax=Curtobacterium ammoniigenes TaxID=395387 RepID=UPI0008363741|nr:septation protein SepH [Curtobacterium ammoniigenes]
MQDVRVIGVESGALLLANDTGSEFRLPVTSTLTGHIRKAGTDGQPHRRISPKDVQARIRAGASAEQVAAAMEIDTEYVRRYEGPVLAERAFILDAAQRVRVHPDGERSDTFGADITARLEDGGAADIRWEAWKDPETGWRVQVHYRAAEVDHDAQWTFEPKTAALTALNDDANRLSDAPDEGITPRLRAVEFEHAEADDHDTTHFDSGAFRVEPVDDRVTDPDLHERPALRPALPRIGMPPVVDRAPGNETADLLEALRRRRGERESAAFGTETASDEQTPQEPQRARPMSVVEMTLDPFDDDTQTVHGDTAPQRPVPADLPATDRRGETDADQQRASRPKRGRRSMPSWDEIVFGTRSDDDLA